MTVVTPRIRDAVARPAHPNRIFEATLDVARPADLVGRNRVLDSIPLSDTAPARDTITLVCIRGLRAANAGLAAELRADALQRRGLRRYRETADRLR